MTDPIRDRKAAVLAARAELERHLPRFLGVPAEDAKALAVELGVHLRIVELDGDGWYTGELRHDRITAETRGGVVVHAAVA